MTVPLLKSHNERHVKLLSYMFAWHFGRDNRPVTRPIKQSDVATFSQTAQEEEY